MSPVFSSSSQQCVSPKQNTAMLRKSTWWGWGQEERTAAWMWQFLIALLLNMHSQMFAREEIRNYHIHPVLLLSIMMSSFLLSKHSLRLSCPTEAHSILFALKWAWENWVPKSVLRPLFLPSPSLILGASNNWFTFNKHPLLKNKEHNLYSCTIFSNG